MGRNAYLKGRQKWLTYRSKRKLFQIKRGGFSKIFQRLRHTFALASGARFRIKGHEAAFLGGNEHGG